MKQFQEIEQVPLDVLPLVQKGQEEIAAEKEAQRQEDERWKKIRETQERALRNIFPEALRRFVHLGGAVNPSSDTAGVDLVIPGMAPIQVWVKMDARRWQLNDYTVYILPDFIEDDQDVFWVWDTDDCVVEKDLARALATARELYELKEERSADLAASALPELDYVDLDQVPVA